MSQDEVSTGDGAASYGVPVVVDEFIELFRDGCVRYDIDPSDLDLEDGLLGDDPPSTVGDAILRFTRHVDLGGVATQAIVGEVILRVLRQSGDFFVTPRGRLYYFDGTAREVHRVDGEGRRTLDEDFRAELWHRFNLSACSFSRDLGKDLKGAARRAAPEREVYRFAHVDPDTGVLYVNDFDTGYYAIDPAGIEWRPNGRDVFFLTPPEAEGFTYLDPDERPPLPETVPGERPPWAGSGDAIMRLFGNRVNFAEGASLGPSDQRDLLYLQLHALPFVDLLTARPIIAWVGEKGSGKTVTQRAVGRFIFGPDFTESAMPNDRDDFLAKVTNQALAFIDNYDEGEPWANDVLASIATGTAIDRRELYTTNDLTQARPRCWLSITSRDPPFRRDDVADRCLVLHVDRLPDGAFVGMGDYLRQVTDRRDLLWSVYLDNLRAILDAYRGVDRDRMTSTHRLADWAILVTVIGDALDVGGVETLLETAQTERAAFALEDEPWAAALERWIAAEPATAAEWHQAGELVEALEAVAEDRGLSLGLSTPQGLGKKLSTYEAELTELFDLEIDTSGRVNRYRFGDPSDVDGADRATDLGGFG